MRFKSDSGSKRKSRRDGGSKSIDEVFDSGYPQVEWVREKTRKRAPPTTFTPTFSTPVERGVDSGKSLQIGHFYSRQGLLRARRDAAMLAAS